jgi:hypothetical protein
VLGSTLPGAKVGILIGYLFAASVPAGERDSRGSLGCRCISFKSIGQRARLSMCPWKKQVN